MSSKRESRAFLREVGASSILLTGGILLIITSIRDLLLYLDSMSLMAVGVTNSLDQAVLLLLIGSLLLVASLRLVLAHSTEAP